MFSDPLGLVPCDELEDECEKEIFGCMENCIRARNNKHRMPGVWHGSWWGCMSGCVSYECQDFMDEQKHGEKAAEALYNLVKGSDPSTESNETTDGESSWWKYILPVIPIFTPWPDPY